MRRGFDENIHLLAYKNGEIVALKAVDDLQNPCEIPGVSRWRDITEFLALRCNTSLLLVALVLAGPDWLDDATKTIGQYRKRKNAQRHGSTTEEQADAANLRRMA